MGLFDFLGSAVNKVKSYFTPGQYSNGVSEFEQDINSVKSVLPAAIIGVTAPIVSSLPVVQSAVISAASAVGSFASNVFKSLTPIQQVGGIAAATVAVPAVISSTKLQQTVIKAPSALVNFGSNIGKAIDNPTLENITNIAKENPIVTSLAGIATVAAVGGGIGLAANTISTMTNTAATKKNTNAPAEAAIIGGSGDWSYPPNYDEVLKNFGYDTKSTNETNLKIAQMQTDAAVKIAQINNPTPSPSSSTTPVSGTSKAKVSIKKKKKKKVSKKKKTTKKYKKKKKK
jgi:hypothetical protein